MQNLAQLHRSYQLHAIPDGPAGVRATLRHMSGLVRRFKVNPIIRELAIRIVATVTEKKKRAQARAVQNFVRKTIYYVPDVRGVETVQDPVKTLQLKAGDCDDQSTLAASLLESIGFATKFVAVARAGRFCHVLTQVRIGPNWVSLETTEPWPLGAFPKGISGRMEQHNK